MNYIGRVLNNCKYIYNEINAATLTGAIDVVVVEQPDGSYTCSPFHVRFGKLGVLRSKEKIVDIEINGEPVDIHMKLGESGEAFFVQGVEVGEDDDSDPIPPHLATSPIPPDRFAGGGGPRQWAEQDVIDVDAQALVAGIQQSVTLTPSVDNAPKTFRAETVVRSENDSSSTVAPGRQLSHEFRPIGSTSQPSDDASLSSHESSDFVKEDSPMSVDDRTGGNNANGKRKRRKKSGKKKKNSSTSLSGATSTTEGEIFQIDEDIKPEQQIYDKPDQKSAEPTPTVERDIHFFSDTEITPGSRFESTGENELGPGYQLLKGTEIIKAFPREGHEYAPVQSDTEFETTKRTTESDSAQISKNEEQAQSWPWGELPTSSSEENKQDSQKWMIQNMLGFMKKTKHMRHKNEADGGIYLSELNSDDPEMAALYFPSAYRQTNVTSSQDLTGEDIREEDAESGNGPSLPQSPHSVEGAVCGPKSLLDSDFDKWYREDIAMSLSGLNASADQFNECLVTHEQFCSDPTIILGNPKLVVRIDGKLYSWRLAAPLLLSIAAFRKPLPQMTVARLEGEAESELEIKETGSKQPKKAYSSWFTWSRNNTVNAPLEPESLSAVKIDPEIKTTVTEDLQEVITDEVQELPLDLTINPAILEKPSDLNEPVTPDFNAEKYKKSLRLTSEQIASLKLQPGANEIQFSVTTAYQGTTRCKCFLYCWRYDDKIVVSDIDGTITKSDVLGHILPIVGKDWAQSGVAKLFTKIRDNGYKLLYLSARAIGQSRVTRDYLKSIKQEDLSLPEGPMLLNPTSLLNAFHTEVIEKKPEEFKISCLKDIQALFPSHLKPFYAGYGNKINDVWAYQAVGIPIFRIFTINHRGELKHELTETFQSTYTNMSHLVDQMFPANNRYSTGDFSQFVYWREPIVDISLELSSH